ncbi:MAG: HAD family hydrolase [Marmoricola sp.]
MSGADAALVVDIDGTLVDSNYQHVVAWSRAFADAGAPVPGHRLHAVMGMGGDKLVAEVLGGAAEQTLGDRIRRRWKEEFDGLLAEVRPLPAAAELLAAARARGVAVVLATSGKPDHTRHALGLLGLDEDSYPLATSEEVDATKPDGDLVSVALRKVGCDRGLMLGDTVWDVLAAREVGIATVGLLTGGISRETLLAGGAVEVRTDARDLLAHLDDVLGAGMDREPSGTGAS